MIIMLSHKLLCILLDRFVQSYNLSSYCHEMREKVKTIAHRSSRTGPRTAFRLQTEDPLRKSRERFAHQLSTNRVQKLRMGTAQSAALVILPQANDGNWSIVSLTERAPTGRESRMIFHGCCCKVHWFESSKKYAVLKFCVISMTHLFSLLTDFHLC